MAENTLEREYVVPLRRAWLHVPHYNRTSKAIKTIKKFIAKHMKVEDRDPNKVKLRKEGDKVLVTFVEIPESVKFLKAKNERIHQKADKIADKVSKEPADEKAKASSEEEKKEEVEKEKSVAEHNMKEAEKDSKVQKHVTQVKEPKIQRMALKK